MIRNQNLVESYLLCLEDIDNLNEYFLTEGITVDTIKRSFTSNLKKMEDVVKDYVDVDKLKSKAKNISVDLKKEYKKGVSSKDMGKKLTSIISRELLPFLEPLKKKLVDTAERLPDATSSQKIVSAVGFFIILLALNGIFYNLLYISSGSATFAFIAGACIVAPITEEALKSYMILNGMPWSGTAIVFGFELVMYVFKMLMMGMSLPEAVLIRCTSLLFHFSTTFLQKIIIDKGTIDGAVEEGTVYTAWLLGALCHCAWNTMAVTAKFS
jgi:hypothetical protein